MSRHVTILVAFFLSAMLLGSIGAFLFYVPAIAWLSVMVVLIGMILMFLLGVQAGARRIRISRRSIHVPASWKTVAWVSLKRAG